MATSHDKMRIKAAAKAYKAGEYKKALFHLSKVHDRDSVKGRIQQVRKKMKAQQAAAIVPDDDFMAAVDGDPEDEPEQNIEPVDVSTNHTDELPEVKPVSAIEKIIAGVVAAPGILILIFVFIASNNDSISIRPDDLPTAIAVIFVTIIPTILAAWYIQMREDKYKKYAAEKYEAVRIQVVKENREKWGDDFCESILGRQIAIDMTQEMVILAWGEPDTIDQHEVTTTMTKERWIYGTPRVDARYVSFKNGKVSKIKAS